MSGYAVIVVDLHGNEVWRSEHDEALTPQGAVMEAGFVAMGEVVEGGR